MTAHPDGTTSQAAAKPSRELDSPQQHVHRLPEHERAKMCIRCDRSINKTDTHIALLLIYVPNLEPNVCIGERAWRIAQYAIKAPQTFVVFSLLLVDDPQPEEDLIGLVEV
jgi:hypothetical protein